MAVSSTESQTFSSEIKISCNLCIYVATCEEELNWHMEQSHDQSGESLFDKDFYCDICSKWFDTEPDMIKHRKPHQKALHVNSLDGDRLYITFVKILFSAIKI